MQERAGVRIGQRVRDLDGRPLGKVTRLYESGFAARKGLFLFRNDYVVRYEEVRGMRDGAIVVARSSRDLFDLAAGAVPPAWRIPAPPQFPPIATPPEAQLLVHDLARGAIVTEAPPAPAREPPPAAAQPGADEEREYARARGESAPAQPPR